MFVRKMVLLVSTRQKKIYLLAKKWAAYLKLECPKEYITTQDKNFISPIILLN